MLVHRWDLKGYDWETWAHSLVCPIELTAVSEVTPVSHSACSVSKPLHIGWVRTVDLPLSTQETSSVGLDSLGLVVCALFPGAASVRRKIYGPGYQLELACETNGLYYRVPRSKMLNGKSMPNAEKSCARYKINPYSTGDLHCQRFNFQLNT